MKETEFQSLGVFDSGIGGLTVVKALRETFPGTSIYYIGDTDRFPYGNKSPEAVVRYSREIAQHLLANHRVQAIVSACNTASAHAVPVLQNELDIPVFGVLRPGVEAALQATQNGRIGIIGTRGTIGSGAYQKGLRAMRQDLYLEAVSTPLLAPLVEEHWFDHPATRLILEDYLESIRRAQVDTLVLGCTHYPLLKPLLAELLGPTVTLVDSASACAKYVYHSLEERGLTMPGKNTAEIRIFLTDLPPGFSATAEKFLGFSVPEAQVVSLT